MGGSKLDELKAKYGASHGGELFDPAFRKVADKIFTKSGTRLAPYAGVPTFLSAPYMQVDAENPDFGNLQVAITGVPMDLGVTNRPGSRFGPRAMRSIERIGPYNHVLDCAPVQELRVADIGDVPFQSRYRLELSHDDIEKRFNQIVDAGVIPLAVGGDHSITHPIMKAVGKKQPVGMIHIDAHCDTGGSFDGRRSSTMAARFATPCSTACSTRPARSRSAFAARRNISGSSPTSPA
jgi:arginase family enzyme